MRTGILIIVISFISSLTFAQKEYCKDIKTGVFQFDGLNGGVYTVIRSDTNQFERNTRSAQHSYMKIRWLNDCQYILSDEVTYKWGKKPKKDKTFKELHNIVYKFEQPDKYFVKSYIPKFQDTIETIFKKLETAKYNYNNIFQLPAFAEYKDSKTYGQTALGEINGIEYYESTLKENRYLIIFEATYQAENINWSRLLDSITIDLMEGQSITNSNCRYKGEYDDEVVAVYTSTSQEQEANIIKAFRCNRQAEKNEPVDRELVQYTESDRGRIKW